MKASIPRLFADVTAKLEDLHSIAMEGQQRDNSSDMYCALVCQLRTGMKSLDTSLAAIRRGLGDARD